MEKQFVWELPIRLFHWLLVLAVVGLFVTAKLGGNWMEWHTRLGYVVLGLVLFRLVWGIMGSANARFGNFVRGPKAVMHYAKSLFNNASPQIWHGGHNPVGGWSVVAMLALLGFQAVSGLFANDDIMVEGPYANTVSKAVSDYLTTLHKLNSDLLLILFAIHIAAILFYLVVKKDNLIMPMLHGWRTRTDAPEIAQNPRPFWVFGLVVVLVTALTYVLATRAFG